jgi:hypothetical protein
MKVNLIKRINLFLFYILRVKNIKNELFDSLNMRIDYIFRMYSVINMTGEEVEEPYNIRKSDIETLSKNKISDYLKLVSDFLDSRGLRELYDVYEVRKVGKYNFLIIFGYSLFNTRKVANRFFYFLILILIFSLIFLIYSKTK